MDKELAGKTALVTGASRGIGAATAVCLARNGVSRLLLHYNTGRKEIEKTLEAVRGEGADAESIQGDLGRSSGIREFNDKLKQSDAEIDILINNAGSLVQRAKLPEFTEELAGRRRSSRQGTSQRETLSFKAASNAIKHCLLTAKKMADACDIQQKMSWAIHRHKWREAITPISNLRQ